MSSTDLFYETPTPATDLPEDMAGAPPWAIALYRETVATRATLTTILDKFDDVIGDIKPAVDELMSSPMLRMLGVKKQKG